MPSPSPVRVAYRYLLANAVPVGETVEHADYRIHRYRDSFNITDLTFAGKRGKKVDEFWVAYGMGNPQVVSAAEDWMEFASKAASFKILVATISHGIDRLEEAGVRVQYGWSQLRGVDVMPAGFTTLKVHTDEVYIEAGYDGFRVRNLKDRYNEPTCIARGKKSIQQFYRWFKDNQSRVQRMTYREVLQAMDAEGIDYHDYCAMD